MARKPSKSKRSSKNQSNTLSEKSGLFQAMRGSKIEYGLMSAAEEKLYLKGDPKGQFSDRSDYGRVIDIKIPQGYHAQVKKSWEMYTTDRLFKYLIDRCIDFGANGFEWEVPLEDPSFVQTKKFQDTKTVEKIIKEKAFWDGWSAKINQHVSNIIPGIDEINKWTMKQLLLGGMAPMEWEWGEMKIGDITYNVPIRMTTHNALSTVLQRTNDIFFNETVKIKLGKIIPGMPTGSGLNSKDWHTIPLMGKVGKKSKLEGFVIKYLWSPGDNTSSAVGSSVDTGIGLYPTPPFYGLNEILLMRRQLCAADISILDGVINYIIDWSIGDDAKDADGNLINQPKPARYDKDGTKIEKSTIETIKEMITNDNKGNVMQLFHPYYYKLSIIMPDINILVNERKYIQTLVEMLSAFGMFLSPTDRRVDFTDINIANFEQMIDNIRLRHIKRFWETLCTEIVEKNKDTLSTIPNMIFNPLNTEDSDFRNGLLNLAKIGKVSIDSLLKAHKLDKRTEILRIAKEIANGEKELMDENVPVSFVQQTVEPGGETKKIDRSATKEGGRPRKGEQKEPENKVEEE